MERRIGTGKMVRNWLRTREYGNRIDGLVVIGLFMVIWREVLKG